MQKVLGVLAGGDMPTDQLAAWARSADLVLAADGGADRLLEAGIKPRTTIGDLDSLSSVAAVPLVIRDPDQETSDCDKLLSLAERLGHESITLCCVEGDRLEHVIGTLRSAARSVIRVRLALRRGVAWVLVGSDEVVVELEEGERVSLMPLEACAKADILGVRWPLVGVELSIDGRTSLSNEAVGGAVTARIGSGAAALIVTSPRFESPAW